MQLGEFIKAILKPVMAGLVSVGLLVPAPVLAQSAVSSRNVPLNVQPGQGPSTINGLVAGNTRLVHSVKVAAGQRLTVELRSNNPELVFGICL